ncbi:UPSTREAM OF FLC protein [Nymphaea thermarum]|nr:UPSTREAM OF FLC protein [Nymphaea thermarum]
MSMGSQEKSMDVSMKKQQQNGGSPSPALPELSPEARGRHRPPKRVSVVYYLCRNGHLEHPHFIEVPLSSSRGLLLKDFVERLNDLRGKGMPALYSWSCKRSYRNGFVWHDLCENDMIYPTNGNEYILKGSELLEGSLSSTPGTNSLFIWFLFGLFFPDHFAQPHSLFIDSQRQLRAHPPPVAVTKQDVEKDSSTSASSPSTDNGKLPQAPDSPPPAAVDASTQTKAASQNICNRGVSTEEPYTEDADRNERLRRDQPVATCAIRVSAPSSSEENPETPESLIHRSIRVTEAKPEAEWAEGSKTTVADMLMQLISCGAISIRNNGHRFVPAYQQRGSPGESRRIDDSGKFLHKSGSSSQSNFLSEKPRLLVVGPERQQAAPRLMPPLERSSNNSERSSNSVAEEEWPEPEEKEARLKCIPLTIRTTQSKPAKCSPHRDHDRTQLSDSANDAGGCRRPLEICKHIMDALPDGKPSERLEEFMEEEKKVVGTEEN